MSSLYQAPGAHLGNLLAFRRGENVIAVAPRFSFNRHCEDSKFRGSGAVQRRGAVRTGRSQSSRHRDRGGPVRSRQGRRRSLSLRRPLSVCGSTASRATSSDRRKAPANPSRRSDIRRAWKRVRKSPFIEMTPSRHAWAGSRASAPRFHRPSRRARNDLRRGGGFRRRGGRAYRLRRRAR